MADWKIKASLFLNYFVFAILLNSSGIAISLVQGNFGVTESAASWIDPCKDLSIAVMSFIVSSFILKLGYKKAMLIALGAVAAACFVIPSMPYFIAIKVLFGIIGCSFALIKMSVYSTIGIITKDSKGHIRFMNFIESFFTVGSMTLFFIFSFFIDNAHPESTSWLRTYYLIGGLAIVAFLLLLVSTLDESGAHAGEEETGTPGFFEMFKLFAKPVIIAFICSAFLYVLIEQSLQNFLPTFNNKVLKLPQSLGVQMASILAGSSALGRFLAGVVLKKMHWFYVLFICLVCAALMVLLAMPLAEHADGSAATGWLNAPIAAYVFPLIGLFLAPVYPSINSAILSSLPKSQHALMSGLIIVFSAIGGSAGSLITGAVFHAYNGKTAFYFSLVPITLLMISLFAFNRMYKRSAKI